MLVNKEEPLVEILVHEMNPIEGARLTALETRSHLHRDAVRSNPEARAHSSHELEVRAISGVEHARAVFGDTAVRREVASQPASQVCRSLVERGALLEVQRQVEDLDIRVPLHCLPLVLPALREELDAVRVLVPLSVCGRLP